jgi:murein DD-endopeptidase
VRPFSPPRVDRTYHDQINCGGFAWRWLVKPVATGTPGRHQKQTAKRGCDVLTGPRKRTSRLIGFFSFSLIITIGSPAHSARSHRYQKWNGHRSRRNYSTSVKRTRTQPKQDRTKRSARNPQATGVAQRVATLRLRSTQPNPVTLSPASRGGVASTQKQSTTDLEAALARRRALLGHPSPPPDESGAADAASPDDTGAPLPSAEDPEAPPAANLGPPVVLSPAERRQQAVVTDALTARGIRYRWGGTSRGGFDCSGFTRYLMARNLGITLPHSASAQAAHGKKVAYPDLQEGDLVFFRTYRRGISHVGMYVGNNRFIHAPRAGRSVAIDSIEGYWRNRYVTARRLKGLGPPGPSLERRRMDLAASLATQAEQAK